jgi:pectin methylesterase-like acyl-CoA thioesterase
MQTRNVAATRLISAFVTLVVALAVLVQGLVFTAPAASAAEGTTPNFRLDAGIANRQTYLDFISAVSETVNYVNQSASPPVTSDVAGTSATIDHTNPSNPGYVEAVIITMNSETLRLRFRAHDLYLVGWFDRDQRYHYIGPITEARAPLTTPNNAPIQLAESVVYGSLEGLAGITRGNLSFGISQTNSYAEDLYSATGNNQAQARAVLYFTQFVSEATRFRGIRDSIAFDGFGVTESTSWGMSTALNANLIAQENNWTTLSDRLGYVQAHGNEDTSGSPLLPGYYRNGRGQIVEETLRWAYQFASVLYLAHGYPGYTKTRRHLMEDATLTVAGDGTAEFKTVQAAIDAVPADDGVARTILIDPGTYNEVITVPSNKPNLTIKGATGNAADVAIKFDRAHGYLKPDGTKYGTQGSAVASFKAPNLRVEDLTIQNTFDPKAHPEVSPYETQAVALLAMADRQVYNNLRIVSTQDTVYAKAVNPGDQTRQYFRSSYIAGDVDFLFGNSTAVFDRATLHVWPKAGATIVAPNTDRSRDWGFLITNSKVISSGAANTFYLGRPWHDTTTAWPMAVIRDTELPAGINVAQPWTNMTTDYTWQQARFSEYHNYGAGAGVNANRPQQSDGSANFHTAQAYLQGNDGWNPVW